MRPFLIVAFLILAMCPDDALAGRGQFEWAGITPEDWDYRPEGDSISTDACVLFEKVTFDETKLSDSKVYITLYRRVRIRSAAGREWADVIIPYFRLNQKVEKVYGRTILPGGTEIPLETDQVFERDLIRVDRRRLKQSAFSLPGVTDDCIIEYAYKVRLRSMLGVWRFQHDVPVRHGELRWRLWAGRRVINLGSITFMMGRWAPNYVCLNNEDSLIVEYLPSEEDCEEILFTIEDIPALEQEPFALPDVARQTQLHCYYGSEQAAKEYWDNSVLDYLRATNYFCEEDKRLKDVAASLDTLASDTEKITAAYAWVRANVRNASYDHDIDNAEVHDHVDDVIKEGYAYASQVNMVFYDLLRQLDIDAHIVLAPDREERLFIRDAKYWQFDDIIVAVRVRGSQFDYYSPGDAGLALGQVRWQNEGVTVLVCGVVIDQFRAMPFSKPEDNRVERRSTVRLSVDGGAEAECVQREWGHPARASKLLCLEGDTTEAVKAKVDLVKENLMVQEVTGLVLQACDGPDLPLEMTCSLTLAHPNPPVANRWIVNPFRFMGDVTNPFTSNERKSPIMFDFAHVTTERLQLVLPQGWSPGALPADTTFSNWAGSCSVKFAANDSTVTVDREFMLKHAHVKPEQYDRVRQLFEARAQLGELAIILEE